VVKASVGHVMDLPKSKIGVDIENGFEPVYEVIEAKKKVVAELKAAAKTAGLLLLATDRTARARPSPGTSTSS